MRRIFAFLFILLLTFSLTACGRDSDKTELPASVVAPDTTEAETEVQIETSLPDTEKAEEQPETTEKEEKNDMSEIENENTIRLFVGEKELSVKWEDNESVDALRELVKEESLSIQMSMYGGFEQVGSLGAKLPRDDVQTTTSAGDIVLYSGNQIVMFYGSNMWAYTRLGKVTDMSGDEMKELLDKGDVTITLSN